MSVSVSVNVKVNVNVSVSVSVSGDSMHNVIENFLFIICNLISLTKYVLNNGDRHQKYL